MNIPRWALDSIPNENAAESSSVEGELVELIT